MTATPVAAGPLGDLARIGLDELNSLAALQERFDRKYIVPIGELDHILAGVEPETRVLEVEGGRCFDYESVYFDTTELISFQLAARKRRRRFKIRTRVYLDSGTCWLEVKTEGQRGNTLKHRVPYDPAHARELEPGRGFVEAVLAAIPIAGSAGLVFVPTLVTRYRRSTLYLPTTQSRVTLDTGLTWEENASSGLHLPGLAIVETKTGSRASRVDRLLWARGHRPVRISKYATGLAALRPELPSGLWRRTLRRHFATGVPAPPAIPAL